MMGNVRKCRASPGSTATLSLMGSSEQVGSRIGWHSASFNISWVPTMCWTVRVGYGNSKDWGACITTGWGRGGRGLEVRLIHTSPRLQMETLETPVEKDWLRSPLCCCSLDRAETLLSPGPDLIWDAKIFNTKCIYLFMKCYWFLNPSSATLAGPVPDA